MKPRLLVAAFVLLACRKAQPEVRPDDKAIPARVQCSIPKGELAGVVTVPARCDLSVAESIQLPTGATLDIAEGAKLSFAKGTGVVMRGGVVRARGTASDPIVLTASAGEWLGVTLDQGEALFEHVVITGASTGLLAKQPNVVTKLDDVKLDGNGVAFDLPFDALPLVTRDPGGIARLHGKATKSITLPKWSKPYLFDRSASIEAGLSPVRVEIGKGATVMLERRATFVVDGHVARATLVAHDVTFTSQSSKPGIDDWGCLVFQREAGAEIEGSIFEHAGDAPHLGVIRLPTSEKHMKVTGSTFRANALAAFETFDDCKKWEAPALKNVSSGKPLCELNPMTALSTAASLKLIAALGAGSSSPLFDSKAGSMFDGPSLGSLAEAPKPKPMGKVTELSIVASGALPVDVVRSSVRARTASLRSCTSSGAVGSLTVSFTIDAKGSVSGAKVTGGTIPDATMRTCVASVFEGISFPAADPSGTTTVTATHAYDAP